MSRRKYGEGSGDADEAEIAEFKGTHAPGLNEFTICGMAFDAHDSGDAAEPIVVAEVGQMVTCPTCRDTIDHARTAFKRYHYTGETK